MQNKTGTILICAYNEERNLADTVKEIENTLANLSDIKWHILIVDDGSYDDTWKIVKQLSMKDPKISGLKLSRNFGYHPAISCGINNCSTDLLINITADGEEPTKYIPELIKKYDAGFDVVWAIRKKRRTPLITKIESLLAQKVIRLLVTTSKYPNYDIGGGYFLISYPVINSFNSITDKHRSVISLISWLGFRYDIVYYYPRGLTRPSRWSLNKKLNYFIDVIYADSVIPCKAVVVIMLVMIFFVPVTLIFPTLYFHLVLLLLLICLGMLAPYLWLILEETRNRPLYIIAERVGKNK